MLFIFSLNKRHTTLLARRWHFNELSTVTLLHSIRTVRDR